jgi:hypothetical protein
MVPFVQLSLLPDKMEVSMNQTNDVKKAVAELLDNLGTVGMFMLGEARAFLRRSWGASREEFMTAVDNVARTMKRSGEMATDDIERAADQIKKSWELLDQEKNLDWDNFLKEITNRLNTIGQVSRESFEICVNQAREVLDRQWTAAGRIGEDQLETLKKQTDLMAEGMKDQWSVFWGALEKTGKKVDRAMDAAWEEFRKKD